MMRIIALLMLAAVPVVAQGAAPDTSPIPEQRPTEKGATGTAPSDIHVVERAAPQPGPGTRDILRLDDAAYAACLATLDAMGVVYEETDPIVPDNDPDCGILRPLSISAIAPGVAIEPVSILRCPTAQALAKWTRDFVLPAARRLDDRGALTAIENGSGYICRRRNNQPDGKLSEHAFGNAFDVMGFRFSKGRPIAIEPREAQGTLAESFQDAVRASACLDFSTVLGPGSNAQHDNHLHFDIITRSSGYRLCEQGGALIE
ncbi:extensin family protein [Oceaniglobus ichthyenteri]|uniref:extensin-like domain-containing protein n=1 Tax=Oceaniglobus ichthyenteri TaxID=2136177 RepID=UPI000D3D6992|nr:extensin family protein [Oceaniglobus ichthyenteri]